MVQEHVLLLVLLVASYVSQWIVQAETPTIQLKINQKIRTPENAFRTEIRTLEEDRKSGQKLQIIFPGQKIRRPETQMTV